LGLGRAALYRGFPILNRRTFLRTRVLPICCHLGLLLFLLFCGTCPAHADDPSAAFEQANRLYEQGKFEEAAAAYEKMIGSRLVSPALYFNLGNALFKSGQLGRAILNYRLAEQLAPRDPDIRANLRFARNHVDGATAPPGGGWRHGLERLTINEWTALMCLALWLWFGLLALAQWRPELKKSLRGYTATAGAGAAVLAACLALVCYDRWEIQSAIVSAREAVVRYGPLDESQSFYTVRDGAELTVLDSKGDWLQVTDRAKRTGWLRREQVLLLPMRFSFASPSRLGVLAV
jgi:tetratricopeptide (TPR) repeat protein